VAQHLLFKVCSHWLATKSIGFQHPADQFCLDFNNMDSFDEIACRIKPDPYNAMILLAERSSQTNRSKALDILHQIEVEPISYEILRSEYPTIFIIYLPVDDLPEAVLKLTEKGFTKMKAIHPKFQGR
jgi:hypothetical protein